MPFVLIVKRRSDRKHLNFGRLRRTRYDSLHFCWVILNHMPKTTLDDFGQARTGFLAVDGSLDRCAAQ